METNAQWLNRALENIVPLEVVGKGNANSGNRNPKDPDQSFDVLMDLLNKGYDRVQWVLSHRDKEPGEICTVMDQMNTTWDLRSFLNITAKLKDGINITAAEGDWDSMSDEERLEVINTAQSAYDYAKQHNFDNLPKDVVDTIAEDVDWADRFITQFLKRETVADVPTEIVNAVAANGDLAAYLNDLYGDQDNFPKMLKEISQGAGGFVREVGKEYGMGESGLHHRAPIFEHSHVGCKCYLAVFKSDNPSDVVFVSAEG